MGRRLAVVVPTTQPWPEVRPCLEALLPQVEALDAEVIVADGDGNGVPDDVVRRHDGVLRIERRPGADVFELRAVAVAGATSDVVAITEDHCVVAPDWCRRILDDLDGDDHLLGIAGAVGNGSRRRLIDRANYFMTFAAAVPPIDTARYRFPPVSNVSFRRVAIPHGELAPGFLELRLGPRLLAEGRMLVDDGVFVEHTQSHGFLPTFAAHYNNGRASTGLLTRGEPWPERRRRVRRQLGGPYRSVRATYGALRAKKTAMREAAPSFPLIFLLASCYSAGAIVGLLLGPGQSPKKLV